MALTASTDRKTANSVTPSGTPNIRNAFGIPSGRDYGCPGQTSVCESVCYAGKLERIYKAFLAVLLANWNALQSMDYPTMVAELDAVVSTFRADCDRADKRNAPKGIAPVERVFRIHHDGDFYSMDYARAWAEVCKQNPDIHFWVYTRSFVPALNVVPAIVGVPNLTVYLSVDADNAQHVAAALVSANGQRVQLAPLAATAAEAKALVTRDRAAVPCPEVMGKLPLVTGQRGDTDRKGACVTCNLCVTGRRDVAFAWTGK